MEKPVFPSLYARDKDIFIKAIQFSSKFLIRADKIEKTAE